MGMPQLDTFQVIADPSRRQILQLLARQSMSISQVAENFDMSRPAVSKHLKILDHAGFISITDSGRERHCMLKQDGFSEIHNWMGFFDQFWLGKLGRLDALLQTKQTSET